MQILKIAGIAGGVAAVLFSAGAAFAQTGTATAPRHGVRAGIALTASSSAPTGIRATFEARVQDIKTAVENKITALREKASERVARLKDTVRQQLAQKLDTRFTELNKRWTEHFSSLLTRYTTILGKIQDRANAAAAAGKNVTAVNADITKAKAAIATAQAAVTAQAAKSYALDTVTLDATTTDASSTDQTAIVDSIRSAFKTIHTSLFTDLKALRDGPMTDARTAVQASAKALAAIPGIDAAATTTATTTTTN